MHAFACFAHLPPAWHMSGRLCCLCALPPSCPPTRTHLATHVRGRLCCFRGPRPHALPLVNPPYTPQGVEAGAPPGQGAL